MCEIRANSYVREISVDTNGKATGAVYFDAQGREMFQKAKAVVLAANGTESPRLLLLSKSKLFPDGLANSSGVVGQVPDERKRRRRDRALRASAERVQGRRDRHGHSGLRSERSETRASTAAGA